ncbi:hypothetical protein ES703_64082 [subsurface metagenome]
MPLGVPRSAEERAKRHAEIYGAEAVPPAVRRGLGPVMETIPEVIWSWLPAFPPDPPIPRWAAIRMRGAGRRL